MDYSFCVKMEQTAVSLLEALTIWKEYWTILPNKAWIKYYESLKRAILVFLETNLPDES